MDLPVDIGHTGFDLLDEHSPEGAVVQPVPPGAHEVGVDHSTVVLGVLDQQTSAALAADHGALEEVVVQALALAVAVGVQYCLDLVPGLGIDQSRVLAGILHTLELHDSSVVGMMRQSVQLVLGDGLGRLAWGGEIWPQFITTMTGLPPNTSLSTTTLGNTWILNTVGRPPLSCTVLAK